MVRNDSYGTDLSNTPIPSSILIHDSQKKFNKVDAVEFTVATGATSSNLFSRVKCLYLFCE